MEFDYPDSAQCYDMILDKNLLDVKLIYDIIVIYYFFVVILSHRTVKTNLKNLIITFGRQLDKSPETESQEEKTQAVVYAFGVGLNTLGTLIYIMFGFYIKTWLILSVHPSFTNIITIFDRLTLDHNENLSYYNNYILLGTIVYSIVSNLYDKSFVKKNWIIRILSILKDMSVGLIIFTYDTKITELIKYSFNLTIKFEIISYLIMILMI